VLFSAAEFFKHIHIQFVGLLLSLLLLVFFISFYPKDTPAPQLYLIHA